LRVGDDVHKEHGKGALVLFWPVELVDVGYEIVLCHVELTPFEAVVLDNLVGWPERGYSLQGYEVVKFCETEGAIG
jgi:hypothetical protein